jgi:hypothetical protein
MTSEWRYGLDRDRDRGEGGTGTSATQHRHVAVDDGRISVNIRRNFDSSRERTTASASGPTRT